VQPQRGRFPGASSARTRHAERMAARVHRREPRLERRDAALEQRRARVRRPPRSSSSTRRATRRGYQLAESARLLQGYTDGTAEYWPDYDGDLLPDVAVGPTPKPTSVRRSAPTTRTPTATATRRPAIVRRATRGMGLGPDRGGALTFAADKTTSAGPRPTVSSDPPRVRRLPRAATRSGAIPVYSCLSPNQAGPR
jgi:hypothetical protein